MEDVENVIKKLSDVSAMLFQMYKDETDKENISIRYDQFLAVDNALALLKEQQPKHGHWIEQEGFDGDVYYDCSVCGESWVTVEGTPEDNGMIYCPHCGAKMDEPKDGEQA